MTAFAAMALILAACGGSGDETVAGAAVGGGDTPANSEPPTTALPEITLPPQPPSDYSGFRAQPTACEAVAPPEIAPAKYDAPEDQGLDPTTKIAATITTSCGDIEIELDPGIAPQTVNSFVFLARRGYFDGTVSHRIIPGFVIQAGDPSATGRDGPGYTIPDELPAAGFVYSAGTLAMANAGPDTTGSQFFIVLADAPLNNDFSVFGRVTGGADTLERIAAIPLGPNPFGELSVPLETLYIETVTIGN